MQAVEAALSRAARLRTVLTERPGHATELAREACEQADALFVFAGDGGYNEALNGLDGVHSIGFVPGGGSSVLARALGIAREARRGRRAARGRTARGPGAAHLGGASQRAAVRLLGRGGDRRRARAPDGRARPSRGRASGPATFASPGR